MRESVRPVGSLRLLQGERLSHAVGCAFAACLERKQRREKECGVTASFDASRTSFVREGSFRSNPSCQQSCGGERDDKLQDQRKGRSQSVALGIRRLRTRSEMKKNDRWTHFLFQNNLLPSRPSRPEPPPRPRGRRPPWSGPSLAGLTPSRGATRLSSSWCAKARSGDSRRSARGTLPSRGSCRCASTTCRPLCNARPTSRTRTPVSPEVLEA